MGKYYSYERLNDHIYRIKDTFDVAMYLVIGNEKACLIDTGYGFTGLRETVEEITTLPVEVFLTHGHIDHAGGIYEFKRVFMNFLDTKVLEKHRSKAFREYFLSRFVQDFKKYDYQKQRDVELMDVKNGDLFDLGGIHVKAYHVPGHTPGMIMYLLVEDRTIIFGDGCGPGTLLIEDCSTSVSTYLRALRRLKTHEGEYDRILRNHGTGISPKELLNNVMEVCERVLSGQDEKILLPAATAEMFCADGSEELLNCYSAKKILENGTAADGKEGNVNYRSDKAG